MIIGYAKIEAPQTPAALDDVRARLQEVGAESVVLDCDAAWNTARPENGIDTALAACRQGDTLVVLSPAQLTQSLAGLVTIANRLTAQGAALRVIEVTAGQTLDTGTPTGALMLGALGLMAAFEMPKVSDDFTMMAPAPRRPRGRPPTASTKAHEIARLRAAGMSAVDIAARLNICRASVYRVLTLGTGTEEQANPATTRPQSRPVFPALRKHQMAAY